MRNSGRQLPHYWPSQDMIIRGGENIYPKEIEEFIYTHPKVQDVQVIGVPDERYGRRNYGMYYFKRRC